MSGAVVKENKLLDKARKFIESGNLDEAEGLLNKLLNKSKKNIEALFLSGCIKFNRNEFSKAVDIFKTILNKNPENLSIHLNLGVALNGLKDYDNAMLHLKKVISKQPDNFIAHYNLGSSYKHLQLYQEAKSSYLKVISINPDYKPVYGSIGFIYNRLGEYQEAANAFLKEVELKPSDNAYVNLMASLNEVKSPQVYKYALDAISLPNATNALVYAYSVLIDACDGDVVEQIQDKVLSIASRDEIKTGVLQDILLVSNSRSNIDPETIFYIHKLWGKRVLNGCEQHHYSKQISTTDKLRIGYLSADFRAHSVGMFIHNIIRSHNKDLFDIYCYSNTSSKDSLTNNIIEAAHNYIDVSLMTDKEIANKIHDDGIHILVDLAGHTTNTGVGALAYSPAPVQITYLGYPNTTGLETVDYRITDNYAESDEGTLYLEELLKMPSSFLCFGDFIEREIESVVPAARNNYITFASFNNIRKLTPDAIRVWSNILKEVEHSKLILKASRIALDYVKENILLMFKRHGIEKERIVLRGLTASKAEHLDMYNQVDISLDTYPYNGTTTTCEALWMGVPVITLVGKQHAQRVSYSILKNIEVEDTITFTEEEYIDKAVELATNPEKLKSLRARIPTAIRESILCNPEKFTRQLEDLYRQAWGKKMSNEYSNGAISDSPQSVKPEEIQINNTIETSGSIQPESGQWVDYIARFPYAIILLPIWERYLNEHGQDKVWLLHQMALDYYAAAHEQNVSDKIHQQCLQAGYQILLQLLDVSENISILQSFARIAIELKEYNYALRALDSISKMLTRDEKMDLSEPFISVSENFEVQDPEGEIGEWVAGAVLKKTRQLQELVVINEAQDTEVEKDSNKTRRLHIGGKQAHPEWEIINAIAAPEVDHVGNAKDLSRFEDNTFSELYGSHVLEHFDYAKELNEVLLEWYRVLKPGGKLYISVPDLNVLSELILKKDKLDLNQRFHVMRMMFGGQVDEYDYHKVGLNFDFLQSYLIEAEYTNIRKVDEFSIFEDTSNFKPYGVPISLNVIAEKPEVKKTGDKKILTAAKAIDIFSDDTFLVSYPRSGNTWMRFMLASALKTTGEVNFSNIEEFIPDLYSNSNISLSKIVRPRIIKSHEKYNPGYPKVIYMYRDVRDVLMSFFYYLNKIGNDFIFDDYFEKFLTKDLVSTRCDFNIGTWYENLTSWFEHKDEIVLVKYEDILEHPVDGICNIFNGLNLEYDKNIIKSIVDKHTFSKMQSKEESEKDKDIAYLKNSEKSLFIRKGKSGEWKEYLTDRHKDRIKELYGEILIELGYEQDTNW